MQKNGNGVVDIEVSDVVFREDLYPRIKHDATVVQKYAENLEVLPPIEVNQRNELIDGFHRWTAHRKVEAKTIRATVTPTASDAELIGLAIDRNAKHGLQLSQDDKKKLARQLYLAKTHDRAALKILLSVSEASLSNWLSDIDKAEREARKKRIQELWLACYTEDEIAELVSLARSKVAEVLSSDSSELKKGTKVAFSEDGWAAPIYNVWAFAKKSNEVSHFGNSEQRITDGLLYLYTEPFDIVIDPFAGGGSTIDICKRRMRRYWASDRKPIVERENEIRQLDVIQELPPLHKRWSEVSLTYLDPPYWKQAEGKYSQDKEDLANMPLGEFTEAVAGLVSGVASKQSKGAIALLIQPTQWNAEGREFTDHVTDILQRVRAKKLTVENRVSCPYSTEQCTPQMVEWAKKNKKLLVISRELIIWRFN